MNPLYGQSIREDDDVEHNLRSENRLEETNDELVVDYEPLTTG